MTRYCAAQFCRNRGGEWSAKQRRVSFYPFPLRDRTRLQEWLVNMKQSKWYPTKHQVLCSDHFTTDCFDVRWGIRYLKPNAIPTIFPCPSSCQDSFYSPQKVSVKERLKCLKTEEKSPETGDLCQAESGWLNGEHTLMANELYRFIPHSCKGRAMTSCQNIGCEPNQSSVRTSLSMARPNTRIHFHPRNQDNEETEATCYIQVEHFRDLQISVQEPAQPDTIELTPPDESVIAIILPKECSEKDTGFMGHSVHDDHQYTNVQQLDLENVDTDAANVTLESEHSYCRQGFNRVLLWEKITRLKSKIAHLEIQENATLSRLQSLETLIGQLKHENLLSDEKLKLVESCFNNCEITAVQ